MDGLLARLKDVSDYDEPLQLQLMKETHTSSGMTCYYKTNYQNNSKYVTSEDMMEFCFHRTSEILGAS